MKSFLIAIIFANLLASVVEAQSFYAARRKEKNIILVAGTGTSTYFGELANDGDYLDAKPNLNAGLQYFFNNRISARAEITWFALKGSDAEAGDPTRVPRNLSFTSNNYEISATGAVNLLSNGNRHYRRPNYNMYAFAGIGLMYYNPKTEYQGEKVALRPLQTELVKYSSFGVVIPYGLGFRFKVSPAFNISIEGGYRKTFTDYLDDVSTTHKDLSKFTDPLAAALSDRRPEIGQDRMPDGTKRGSPDTKDGYMLLNAKVEYYLDWDFSGGSGFNPSFYKKKKSSSYRYNKKGGLKKRRN
ncbi:MAG: DUF6089 family protein [Bacteroidota bacterium]